MGLVGYPSDPGAHPMSKYHNIKTEVDGIKFDSKREASRYCELKLLQKGGVISSLKLQPRFLLLDAFEDARGVKHRKVEYVADFTYFEDGKEIVEDVKGMLTDVFKLKVKFFLNQYRHITFITT